LEKIKAFSVFFCYFCKKKMMNRWLIFFIIVLSLVVLLFYYIRPYYTPAEKQTGMSVMMHQDDTIRIAYIGDSWADGHKNKKCVIDSLLYHSIGRPVLVRTEGISGLTSKNIYYSIFRDSLMRKVIEWGPDFCFVVAGINDSDRKMGKGYYKENMRLIIGLLLEKNIVPIILEIPSYDIRFSFKRRSRQIKLQYLFSMLFSWSKMDCIQDYRDAYVGLLTEQGWNEKVITVKCDDWNPDGYNDARELYDGGLMHLNSKGYLVLDTCISQKIIDYLNGPTYSVSH
jgi:lysophospholipase L1-like esterase